MRAWRQLEGSSFALVSSTSISCCRAKKSLARTAAKTYQVCQTAVSLKLPTI